MDTRFGETRRLTCTKHDFLHRKECTQHSRSLRVFFLLWNHGRRKRAKIGQSEGKSAREDGESRRWKHAEYVPLIYTKSLFVLSKTNWKLCALSTRILTLSRSLSLSLFDDDRIERSGEIDPVQGVHAIVRVDFKPRGTEKTRGE